MPVPQYFHVADRTVNKKDRPSPHGTLGLWGNTVSTETGLKQPKSLNVFRVVAEEGTHTLCNSSPNPVVCTWLARLESDLFGMHVIYRYSSL